MHMRDLLHAVARTTGDPIRTIKRIGFQLIAEPPVEQTTNQQGLFSAARQSHRKVHSEKVGSTSNNVQHKT